ncbi:hypothetical protein [Kribbella sp. NBC_00889]|uniref:hypothetical protein n=1 Tax=Kribbella sp. NBC_00889 TaxID=2975974 RepID=UPI00386B18C2|nr:hypothetical protein OG817_13695 [Kribbella sp. NBC_00889]
MKDIDKQRTQRDAQRNVAGRATIGSSRFEQAMLRYLGVELYKERHRRANAVDGADAEQRTDQRPAH